MKKNALNKITSVQSITEANLTGQKCTVSGKKVLLLADFN